MTDRMRPTETAKEARKALKAAFPGTKFSVRTSGNAVTVYWTDGPTSGRVKEVVGHMKAGHFDGQIDSYQYNGSRFGNRYLFITRYNSVDLVREVQAHMVRTWVDGAEFLTLEIHEHEDGTAGWSSNNYDLDRRMHEELNRTNAWPLHCDIN